MHINIESVSIEDVPRITEIEKVCFPYDYWNEKSIEYAVDHMDDASYRYIFLKATNEDDTLMGYIIATLVSQDCEIHNVAVDTPYRRNHIAERLFAQLEDVVQGLASNIFLEVRRSNTSAQALYRKIGFQTIGKRKGYYDYPKEDAILMVKTVGNGDSPFRG